jgi:hypothetical protein
MNSKNSIKYSTHLIKIRKHIKCRMILLSHQNGHKRPTLQANHALFGYVKAIFSINILFHICKNLYKVRMPAVDKNILVASLVEKYGTYTTVNGHIRAVYAPYFHRNPGRCFTTVCNENTVCIRPYTAQNAVLYAVP